MRNKDAFSGYHPTINFLYFALVLLFSMCLMHPAYLLISLTGALTYDIYLKGRKAARFAVMGLLPMAVFAALVNPAFNHEGATILTYLPSGNPLTLESMLYGAAAAVMLASVVLWFSSYNEVMTSDKFVYLFGRVIPALSLVLSMSLRFIPKFKAQMQTVSEAQACIGRDTKNGSVLRRVGNAVKIFSILVTWSLENAIETADSMRSRGYGLPGRTAFSIYRFDDRDKAALAWLIFCGAYLISGWIQASHVPQQAQVLRGPKTAERFALADLPQGFARALLLLYQQGQAAVLETARLRTPPLVGGAVVHPRRQQAMPGQGQTHGSVHEYFEVHTGKRFRQCSDLFEAQFPGQIDPLHPGLTPERHSGAVYGMGLCGQMQRH